MRIVDLSVTLDNDRSWAPRFARNSVKRQSHQFGKFAIWWLFRLPGKYLRTGLGWANDTIELSTHGTTHVDAPWHYGPTSEGQPAKTIDQVPLEWCYGPGVVLDLRHKQHGEAITAEDVRAALDRIEHWLNLREIVLIQTGNDRRLGTPEYFTHGPGMSAEATRWILDQGVKLTGIDSWGWDVPLPVLAARAKESRRDGRLLGRSLRRHRQGILPHRAADESRSVALERLHHLRISVESERGLGRARPRRRSDRRGVTAPERGAEIASVAAAAEFARIPDLASRRLIFDGNSTRGTTRPRLLRRQ